MPIFSAHEMIPKTICSSALSTDGPNAINEICRLVTRSGLTSATLNFLRLCNIMEPMTELFTFHKVGTRLELYSREHNYSRLYLSIPTLHQISLGVKEALLMNVFLHFRRFEWSPVNVSKTAFTKNGTKL